MMFCIRAVCHGAKPCALLLKTGPATAVTMALKKYSILDQINADNVSQLEVSWEWESVDNPLWLQIWKLATIGPCHLPTRQHRSL